MQNDSRVQWPKKKTKKYHFEYFVDAYDTNLPGSIFLDAVYAARTCREQLTYSVWSLFREVYFVN
jgi:hypothetical protein